MFWQAVGVGLGIGIVHSAALFFVLFAARTNAKRGEDDTLELMRERNELDRQKVAALQSLRNGTITNEEVESFIRDLSWSDDTPDDWKTIASGNIRHFWQWVQS